MLARRNERLFGTPEKGAHSTIDIGWLHCIAQDAAPRGWMQQACPLKGKQLAEFCAAPAGPVGDILDTIVSRQLGQHGDGENERERIAEAATITLISECLHMLIESVDIEHESTRRQRKGKGKYGRVHATPFVSMMRPSTAIILHERCERVCLPPTARLCSSPGALWYNT